MSWVLGLVGAVSPRCSVVKNYVLLLVRVLMRVSLSLFLVGAVGRVVVSGVRLVGYRSI